jgi:HD-GYP domain-containing protein (c-di-GMP phosphodiesterase class II)
MDELTLSRNAAASLRTHVRVGRRAIASAVVRTTDGSKSNGSLVSSLFVNALLDRLIEELEEGRREPTDAWAHELGRHAEPGIDRGTLAILACATITASFAREHPGSHAVPKFLALRGKQLAAAFEAGAHEASGEALPSDVTLVDRGDVVSGLLASLEACDLATCEHSRAVGAWAGRIGRSLGLSAEAERFVALCGTLHDVGKVATPERILLKPGPLDREEWSVMREHSAAGGAILQRISSLRECAPVVRAHHERIDGQGYPDRLSGTSIPLAARIIAVADSFHAMISNRPYRDAISAPQALATLMEGRGDIWDPIVVDAMLGMVQPQGANLPRLRIVGRQD